MSIWFRASPLHSHAIHLVRYNRRRLQQVTTPRRSKAAPYLSTEIWSRTEQTVIDAIMLYFVLVSLYGEARARERQPLGYGTVSVSKPTERRAHGHACFFVWKNLL